MRIKLGPGVRVDDGFLEVGESLTLRFVDPNSHSGGREWRVSLSESHFSIEEGTDSGGSEVESGDVAAGSIVIET